GLSRGFLAWSGGGGVPVGQDVGAFLVEKGPLFGPPVHVQDEIAVLAVAPERLVPRGFALGVVVDDAVDDLPVSVIARRHFPPGQILAVEERNEPLGRRVVCRPGRDAEQYPHEGKPGAASLHHDVPPVGSNPTMSSAAPASGAELVMVLTGPVRRHRRAIAPGSSNTRGLRLSIPLGEFFGLQDRSG